MKWRPLLKWMDERHRIYTRKESDAPWPWTKDKIMQTYRFCNVFRELDTVTIWINNAIRQPYKDHEDLWFMLCIARHFNHPRTLTKLITTKGAWPHSDEWLAWKAQQVLSREERAGNKVYTGAYIVNGVWPADYKGMKTSKIELSTQCILKQLWDDRVTLRQKFEAANSLQSAHETLTQYHGWGGFMAYEVVCDMRYTRYLKDAVDVRTWAHAGPGAKRGLKRLGWEGDPLIGMRKLYDEIAPRWVLCNPALEMREIEHSLCEFDKYERVRLGQGRPRSLYQPSVRG